MESAESDIREAEGSLRSALLAYAECEWPESLMASERILEIQGRLSQELINAAKLPVTGEGIAILKLIALRIEIEMGVDEASRERCLMHVDHLMAYISTK